MSKKKPRNVPASVADGLRRRAKAEGEDFQLMLTRYALERLLYRLSRSAHANSFVLKGAMLFALWSEQPHRPTRDLDLLGGGEVSVGRFEEMFRQVCLQPVEEDGLAFQADTVRGELMKEDQDYQGARLSMLCMLQKMRISIDVDVGTGDAITPAPVEVTYPTLLDFPAPHLLAYPRETVVAEKYQAMVTLGMANSRLKDFYDLWVLATRFAFAGDVLCQAIRATFERRRTPLVGETPLALTKELYADSSKRTQWRAFVNKARLETDGPSFDEVGDVLRAFLLPPTEALRRGEHGSGLWPPNGPWPRKAEDAGA